MPWSWSPHDTHPLPFGVPVRVNTLGGITGTVLSHSGQGEELTYRIVVDREHRERVGDISVERVPVGSVLELEERG